jgi:hypothetical protein
MKKALHIILISLKSLSQEVSVSSVDDTNFRYGGQMSNELFVKLSRAEQNAYLGCLSLLRLKSDSIEWCDNDFVEKMSSNKIFPSAKVSWKSTDGKADGVSVLEIGTDKLPKPKCIVFIRRVKGNTIFTFQMYY